MEQPHSLDLERAVLGGVLVDSGAMLELRDRVVPADFFRTAHWRVYEVY